MYPVSKYCLFPVVEVKMRKSWDISLDSVTDKFCVLFLLLLIVCLLLTFRKLAYHLSGANTSLSLWYVLVGEGLAKKYRRGGRGGHEVLSLV